MTEKPPDPAAICFGLSTDLDRSSCAVYLRLLGREPLAATLAGRMDSAEIEQLIDFCTALLRRHLSKQEYHRLFLQDDHSHHEPTEDHD
ncbi:MAG: hypothetical protein IH612_16820 [Desulfofustis sp.]|nr:hypothetical protein [Desulfofustis sp.]